MFAGLIILNRNMQYQKQHLPKVKTLNVCQEGLNPDEFGEFDGMNVRTHPHQGRFRLILIIMHEILNATQQNLLAQSISRLH